MPVLHFNDRDYQIRKCDTIENKDSVTEQFVDVSDAAGQDTPPVTQQMVNNNPTFFNINISGGNNSFYQHVDKLTINNGGKQDE